METFSVEREGRRREGREEEGREEEGREERREKKGERINPIMLASIYILFNKTNK